ncbi:MAG: L-aspartate oxidase [Clostridiales bacterium]|nr:L-aspartate oxidase [Clostridiales bacterium]
MKYDVIIVGCGVSGLYSALKIGKNKSILIICKEDKKSCNSILAQGGICVLRDDTDYEDYFEDTMKAGHYENKKEALDIMIKNSRSVINDLLSLGVRFEKDDKGNLKYTKEAAHSKSRICFHRDITGKEIVETLLENISYYNNINIMEYTTMLDIIVEDNICKGIVAKTQEGKIINIYSKDTILATGGIGGLYKHSTNFSSITGDSIKIAKKHNIKLENLDYVQIHPTGLYKKEPGRHFLISESTRGEGAILIDKEGNRFVDELLPRDKLSKAIREKLKEENSNYVRLSFKNIDKDIIKNRFENIYNTCLKEGYDITEEPIPVVPAQHYFMGGISVDTYSKTSMEHLYAVGETSCTGVHGKNRLASNSLLECFVFAKRASEKIINESR